MSHEEFFARDPTGAEAGSADAFFELVYDQLKRIARKHVREAGGGGTLRTTEVVHEAWLKLAGNGKKGWDGRAHFFGAASRAMRQVLVDHARHRRAAKRGGQLSRVTLGAVQAGVEMEIDEILAVDRALEQLDAVDKRLRQIVELRFFAGLREHDVAEILGVSTRTVERDWLKARLFLKREIEAGR